MAVICGKDGDVKIGGVQLPEITKWTFKPQVTSVEYSSNKTGGFKRSVCGARSATGTLEGKWDDTDPITSHFQDGSSVTLGLYLTATHFINCPALIKSLDIEVDIDASSIISWSAEFNSDGAYTYNV